MFSGDKLVACLGSEVFDVVDEEGVDKGLPNQENNLCTSSCQASYDFSTYASSSSLYIISTVLQHMHMTQTYRHHNHLGMHIPLRSIRGAAEEAFQHVQDCTNRSELQDGPAVWNGVDALVEGCGQDVDGHLGCWWDGKREGSGTRIYGGSLTRSDPRGVIACDCASKIVAWLHHPHFTSTSNFLARRCRSFHRRKTLNPRRLVTTTRTTRDSQRDRHDVRSHHNTDRGRVRCRRAS